MAGAQMSDMAVVLKEWLEQYSSVIGYVLINSEGCVVQWNPEMEYSKAIDYAGLYSRLYNQSSKAVVELRNLGRLTGDFNSIILLTEEKSSVIVSEHQGYRLVVIVSSTGQNVVTDSGVTPAI